MKNDSILYVNGESSIIKYNCDYRRKNLTLKCKPLFLYYIQ